MSLNPNANRAAAILRTIRDRFLDPAPYTISAELLAAILNQKRHPSQSLLAAINERLFEDVNLMIVELNISEYLVFSPSDLDCVSVDQTQVRGAINAYDDWANRR